MPSLAQLEQRRAPKTSEGSTSGQQARPGTALSCILYGGRCSTNRPDGLEPTNSRDSDRTVDTHHHAAYSSPIKELLPVQLLPCRGPFAFLSVLRTIHVGAVDLSVNPRARRTYVQLNKQIACATLAFVLVALAAPPVQANRNFVPDWTFQGSSIKTFRTLGDVDWRAENGEIIGKPRSAAGGWLFLDRPLQDVDFASTVRCTGDCKAGILLRAQTAADGIHGAFFAFPTGQEPAGTYALKLDTAGHELSRTALKPAGGMVRMMVPPDPNRRPSHHARRCPPS